MDGENMIDLNFVIGMWLVDYPKGNWMASLQRKEAKFELMFRFRWYNDDKIFDSKDTRNSYRAQLSDTSEATAIAKAREIFETLKDGVERRLHIEPRSWELLRGERTVEEFMAVLQTMPGMHVKHVPLGDVTTGGNDNGN